MDCRLTLGTNETFLEMLQSCYREQRKVSLMVDDNGLERVEGLIKTITITPTSVMIELEDQKRIDIKIIAAVNGVFLPEYGEC